MDIPWSIHLADGVSPAASSHTDEIRPPDPNSNRRSPLGCDRTPRTQGTWWLPGTFVSDFRRAPRIGRIDPLDDASRTIRSGRIGRISPRRRCVCAASFVLLMKVREIHLAHGVCPRGGRPLPAAPETIVLATTTHATRLSTASVTHARPTSTRSTGADVSRGPIGPAPCAR